MTAEKLSVRREPFSGLYPEAVYENGFTVIDDDGSDVITIPFSSVFNKSLMSRPAIDRALQEGRVFIDPFTPEQLNSNSYDICLGPWYWKERDVFERDYVYNPYSEPSVRNSWKLHYAKPVPREHDTHLDGISEEDLVIYIDPGETLLCHTIEYIGSTSNDVVPMMRGRSSTARNRIKICSDAGLGDIGYCSRWTMEVTNLGKIRTVLVVGRRIGQIEFFETEPVFSADLYGGKYQPRFHQEDAEKWLEDLKRNWSPDSMLPKQWLDWEINDSEKASDEEI